MTYLGKGGKIPYLSKEKISLKAEQILEKNWSGIFPVDVESLCDSLDISILPIPDLSRLFHIDAFISADFKIVYVDDYQYKKETHRYRFSVAHEIGHFVLHQKYYPKDITDFKNWLAVSHRLSNKYAEYQANYFAGILLVPEAELIRLLNDFFHGDFAKNYWHATPNELSIILKKVREHFKVSDSVIGRRMRDAFPGIGE